jgi:hypothetical protein
MQGQPDPWAETRAAAAAGGTFVGGGDQNRPSGDPKKYHVPRVKIHEMDLVVISDEKKFLPWRAKFDMEVDDIWSGLEPVLKEIRVMKRECSAAEFNGLVLKHAMRPDNYEPLEWSFGHIGKQLYKILFKKTELELHKIVSSCDKDRDGIEAYRLLSKHCDPYTFNTAGTLMEAITEMGSQKPGSVDELLSLMREMKKRLATYEERVKPLPDAKTTWIPSTLIRLMDRESLTYVRKAGASEDFDKMLAAVEELREINKSIRTSGTLRRMGDEGRDDDDDDQGDDD